MPMLISALKGSAYVASVSVDCPKNVIAARKAIKKAFQVQLDGLGFSFVSFLSTCPTNWGLTPRDSIKWLQEQMIPYYVLGELKTPEDQERVFSAAESHKKATAGSYERAAAESCEKAGVSSA